MSRCSTNVVDEYLRSGEMTTNVSLYVGSDTPKPLNKTLERTIDGDESVCCSIENVWGKPIEERLAGCESVAST